MSFDFSKSKLPTQLFINNEYVDSKNSTKLTLNNPADGSLVTDSCPLGGEQDVDEAVAAAEKAFPAWKKVAPGQRRDIMYKFASLVEQHTDALAELTRITLGAPFGSFGKFEVGMAAEVRINMFYISAVKINVGRRHSATTPAGSTNSQARPSPKTTASSKSSATSPSA